MPFLFAAALFLLSAIFPAIAADPTFSHPGVAKDAERYEAYLKANWRPGKAVSSELKAAGDRNLAQDPRGASRSYALAAVADAKNAEAWTQLAKALLAIKADPEKGSERYDLPVNASGAAFLAYTRAADAGGKARALAVLGQALQRRSYWRPSIDALKTSLALTEDGAVRALYTAIRAEHGFRMTDYRTDSDAANPRVCAQFSERLAGGNTDFAKFVSVGGRDPQSVSPEGSQLCIEGLTHGQRYEIQLRAGLPSDTGETIEKPIDLAVYVADRKPSVRFTGKSYVLPSRGQQGIPVVTVNTAKVGVEIFRVNDRSLTSVLQSGDLDRQLASYDVATLRERTGVNIYNGELDVTSKLNEEVTTAIPVTEVIGELKPGAYAVFAKAEKPGEDGEVATQWFIVSDLGLTALTGDNGIYAFVRSLADAKPVAGAGVRLVAKNNEVLSTGKTDDRGHVRFDAGLAKGEGGSQPALLVADNGPTDYAFLDLTAQAFDLTDRGVKGRTAPGPLDGFLYSDRGVYRPGETANLTALIRNRSANAATLPVTLIIDRPDGVEHQRLTLTDQGLGGRTAALALHAGAMTGTWRAKLHADPKAEPLTQVAFLVEDFVPERLDLTLKPADGALKPEQSLDIQASGRFLYGPPAANLGLEGDIVVRPSMKDVDGFVGYRFGLSDETIEPVRQPLADLTPTAADGTATVPVTLPAVPKTARPLEAAVMVRLREPGGRTIERSVTLPVDLDQPRIGVKPLFRTEAAEENGRAAFEIVALGAAGQRISATGLAWTLVRLDTNWQWYSRDGNWSYEAVTLTRKAESGTLDVLEDAPAKLDVPLGFGRYRLEIASPAPDGPATSVAFNAGWYANADAPDSPEALDVALDKPSYQAGDTAKLRIASKHAGRALIAVIDGSVAEVQEADLAKGGGEVAIPVKAEWGAGAYAVAVQYRPLDETAKRMPGRAIGVAWLGLDQAARTLSITMETADSHKSGEALTVPVKIGGLNPGEEARITLAAVDVGILNLTRFETPAPAKWFYSQRQLGTEIRDFYGRLIDGMRAEKGKLRSGGDGGGLEMQGSAPDDNTVSFYSGIVAVDKTGAASVEVPLPEFNGTVRLMAVAWSGTKLGHAQKDVIVRDKIALTASGPRILTLGDEARLDLDIHNVEAAAGAYQVSVDQETAVGEDVASVRLLDQPVDLASGARVSQRVAIKPDTVGSHTYAIRVSGADGIDITRRLALDVKPPSGDIKRTTVSQLKGKGGKITISPDLVQDMIAGRSQVNVSVGPVAALDVPSLLSALDRYPYGCAEQTVSRALPLLYANEVATSLGMGTDQALRERVQAAVSRVFDMQDSSGAFGIWGPSEPDLWLTSYVTDFLTRAKEQGYTLKEQGLTQALDRLQNFISYANDTEKNAEARAYALYVLARSGRAPIGELRYWADTKLANFATPLAKAQLGTALAMMGDKARAESVFTAALDSVSANEAEAAITRVDYGSNLRDYAALLTLASESGIAKDEAPRLLDVVTKAYQSRSYTSTQEQAWLLLAAHAVSEQATSQSLLVNGQSHTGPLMRTLSAAEIKAGALTIENAGEAAIDAVVTVTGAALTPEPAIAKGFTIERRFYALDGKELSASSAVKQNDRLVVVLKVASNESGGRVLLVDRLPAGLEIENPRLVESGDIKSIDWLEASVRPEHTEFRDDRFVAAFNFSAKANGDGNVEDGEGNGETPNANAAQAAAATVAYVVRAVTPGTFVQPAATVEDMYRPERYARTAAGRLTVTAQE